MHRWCTLSLIAMLSATTYYAHAQLPPKTGGGIFSSKPSEPKPDPAAKKKGDEEEAPKILSPEETQKIYQLESEAYLRRMAVISKIREMATLKEDRTTLAKIEKLEKEAEDLFNERTAHLPTVSSARAFSKATMERASASTAPSKSSSSPIPIQPRKSSITDDERRFYEMGMEPISPPGKPSTSDAYPTDEPKAPKLPNLEKSR